MHLLLSAQTLLSYIFLPASTDVSKSGMAAEVPALLTRISSDPPVSLSTALALLRSVAKTLKPLAW